MQKFRRKNEDSAYTQGSSLLTHSAYGTAKEGLYSSTSDSTAPINNTCTTILVIRLIFLFKKSLFELVGPYLFLSIKYYYTM